MWWWPSRRGPVVSLHPLQVWLSDDGYRPHLSGLDRFVGHALDHHGAHGVRRWLRAGFNDPKQFWPKITELAVLYTLDTAGFSVVSLAPRRGSRTLDFEFEIAGELAVAEVANLDFLPGAVAQLAAEDDLIYFLREIPGNVNFEFGEHIPREDADILAFFDAAYEYISSNGVPQATVRQTFGKWEVALSPSTASGLSFHQAISGRVTGLDIDQVDRVSHWRVLTEKLEQVGRGQEFKVIFLGISLRALSLVPQLIPWAVDKAGTATPGPYAFFRLVDTKGYVTVVVICQVFVPRVALQAFSFPNANASLVKRGATSVMEFLNKFPLADTLYQSRTSAL